MYISAFLIELVQHDDHKKYIRIIQTIHDDLKKQNRTIKINPILLNDLQNVLNSYKSLVVNSQLSDQSENTITDLDYKSIQKRYLKGIPIKDLALQFDCDQELITQILLNNNIEIVDNKPPKPKYFYRKKK